METMNPAVLRRHIESERCDVLSLLVSPDCLRLREVPENACWNQFAGRLSVSSSARPWRSIESSE